MRWQLGFLIIIKNLTPWSVVKFVYLGVRCIFPPQSIWCIWPYLAFLTLTSSTWSKIARKPLLCATVVLCFHKLVLSTETSHFDDSQLWYVQHQIKWTQRARKRKGKQVKASNWEKEAMLSSCGPRRIRSWAVVEK